MHAHCLGTGDWLCFSSILAVTQSEPREQCPGRGRGGGGRRLRNGTEMGNKKNDRDGPRPGSGFWNGDGNEMVQCYQFNWKLERSILPPMKSRVKKRMRVMGKGGTRKKRTVCKGRTAQFTSVKETIWLQFLLLSHYELLNSWFVHMCMYMYVDVRFCICVCVSKCMWINVSICVFVFVCVWLFGCLCSRCAGLLLCSDILNGWRRHFCGFPASRMGSPPFPSSLCSLVDNYRIGSALLAQLGFEKLTWICQN